MDIPTGFVTEAKKALKTTKKWGVVVDFSSAPDISLIRAGEKDEVIVQIKPNTESWAGSFKGLNFKPENIQRTIDLAKSIVKMAKDGSLKAICDLGSQINGSGPTAKGAKLTL